MIAVLVTSALGGCATLRTSTVQFGAMRDVLRDGHSEARLALTDAAARPNAVAVGALEGLRGEITILDGDVWVSRPAGPRLQVTGPEPVAGDQATLLTLATVGRWQTVSLNLDDVCEGAALETVIEQTARRHGLDTKRPFPFVIDGTVVQIAIHVINGFCPMATDPASVDAEPWRWTSDDPTAATIVGFYAADSAGVMTHHGTSVHAHALLELDGRMTTGHVDQFSVSPGATLRIPTEN